MSILLNEQEKTAYRVTPLGYFPIAFREALDLLKLGKARRVYA